MTTDSRLEETSATERLVLHELARLAGDGRTPAQVLDVLEACRDRIEQLDDVVGGRVTEADVVRSCRTLEETDLVREIEPDATSPVGKGRPAYELAVEPDDVREFVRNDERFGAL